MKEIQLTKGKVTIVDDEDFDFLNKWKWCLHSRGYAKRNVKNRKSQTTLLLHRVITNAPKGIDVDHINGNKLDNRRDNLRLADRSSNIANTKKRNGCLSQYKGLNLRNNGNWSAVVNPKGKTIYLGTYSNEIEAARAYDKAAKEYFGEYASLNFPNN